MLAEFCVANVLVLNNQCALNSSIDPLSYK